MRTEPHSAPLFKYYCFIVRADYCRLLACLLACLLEEVYFIIGILSTPFGYIIRNFTLLCKHNHNFFLCNFAKAPVHSRIVRNCSFGFLIRFHPAWTPPPMYRIPFLPCLSKKYSAQKRGGPFASADEVLTNKKGQRNVPCLMILSIPSRRSSHTRPSARGRSGCRSRTRRGRRRRSSDPAASRSPP